MNETQREVPIRDARSDVTQTAAMPANAVTEYHGAAIPSPDVALLLGSLFLLIWGRTRLANNTPRRPTSHPRGNLLPPTLKNRL